MSDLGARIRHVVDESAPPIDGDEVLRTAAEPRGVRAGAVALGAALVVVMVGGLTFLWSGGQGDRPAAQESTSTSAAETTVTTAPPAEPSTTTTTTMLSEAGFLEPFRVECTAELADYPCSNLLDHNDATSWQAPDGGIGVSITVWFSPPVKIDQIGFTNLSDEAKYWRNGRVKDLDVKVGELAQTSVVHLDDRRRAGPQFVSVHSLSTSVVTITITGAYPGQSFADLPPFAELALADLSFVGVPAPADEARMDVIISGTRGPYSIDEIQRSGEFGPLIWSLVTTLNGSDDIPHGPGYQWVDWGPLWAGRLIDPTFPGADVYGVTDLLAVDPVALAAVVPRVQTVVLVQVDWSLDDLERFADDLQANAPDNGVCATGNANNDRVHVYATPNLDLGDVPPEAVDVETFEECPGYVDLSPRPTITP